ncbi:MAG: hypothetical protein AAGC86_06985 [Pseudomonadota bacterium]
MSTDPSIYDGQTPQEVEETLAEQRRDDVQDFAQEVAFRLSAARQTNALNSQWHDLEARGALSLVGRHSLPPAPHEGDDDVSFAPGGTPDDFYGPDWRDHATDAGWIDPADVSKAMIDVMNESRRQQDEEGWTPELDDTHLGGEMAVAAASYAISAQLTPKEHELMGVPAAWPWDASWWKPKGPRFHLIRSAALILAEIERRDRAEARTPRRRQADGGRAHIHRWRAAGHLHRRRFAHVDNLRRPWPCVDRKEPDRCLSASR